MPQQSTVVCIFRVRSDSQTEFLALLESHWPTLRKLGLATGDPPQRFRGSERDGRPIIFEIFTWASAEAARTAHAHPEVATIWDRMEALTETREGRPKMEFPHVEPFELNHG